MQVRQYGVEFKVELMSSTRLSGIRDRVRAPRNRVTSVELHNSTTQPLEGSDG